MKVKVCYASVTFVSPVDIRYARRNIDLDHATRIKFSPDGT